MEQANTTINHVQIEQKAYQAGVVLGYNTKSCICPVSIMQIQLCCHLTCPNMCNQLTYNAKKLLNTCPLYKNNNQSNLHHN